MKAIQLTAFGGPEVMTISEIADPIPGTNEELINVTSFSNALFPKQCASQKPVIVLVPPIKDPGLISFAAVRDALP